jgi:hypothetical protein
MPDEPNGPDLSELLAPPPPGETPGLRDAILRRTERRLALNRWTRRAVKSAAVAAVFATGVAFGVWNTPRERETVLVPTPVTQVEVVTVPVVVPVFVPAPGGSAEKNPRVAKRTARELELDAEQADDTLLAAKFYRQAGDAYFNIEQDYINAARCYRLYIARSGDNALSPEPDDSWLLTSLKNEAFKEKVHATPANG